MKVVMILVSMMTLAACSAEVAGHKIGGGDVNTASFNYEFSLNGCKTGKHEFSSLDALCDGLKNDSLNNYCAINMRYDEFKARCGDRSWQ